jgi:hypothetical protein
MRLSILLIMQKKAKYCVHLIKNFTVTSNQESVIENIEKLICNSSNLHICYR